MHAQHHELAPSVRCSTKFGSSDGVCGRIPQVRPGHSPLLQRCLWHSHTHIPDSISHYYLFTRAKFEDKQAGHAHKKRFSFSFAPTFYNAAGPSKNAIYRADVAFCFGHVLICGAWRWIYQLASPPPARCGDAPRIPIYTLPPHRMHISPLCQPNFSPGPNQLSAADRRVLCRSP